MRRYKIMTTMLCFLTISITLSAQTTIKPNNFALEPNPNNNNFELYSQKNGINRRATLNSIRDYIIQGIQYVPGPVGPPGPANSLSIGTVTEGVRASATITGTAPSQILNLVFPYQSSGPGSAPDLIDGGKVGNLQSIGIIGGAGIQIDISDNDNDPANELQTLTIDVNGNWALSNGGGSGVIDIKEKKIYIATHDNTYATIWASRTGVTITSNEVTGELIISVPADTELYKVHIFIPFDAVDANNNYYILLAYTGLRTYNTNIRTVNIPSVLVGRASGTISRSSPSLYAPDGNAGVDVGITDIGGGDGSNLEIAIRDFLISQSQFVTLIF